MILRKNNKMKQPTPSVPSTFSAKFAETSLFKYHNKLFQSECRIVLKNPKDYSSLKSVPAEFTIAEQVQKYAFTLHY